MRHKDIHLLVKFSEYSKVPVINAMTDINHPCEVLSDLYALSKIKKEFSLLAVQQAIMIWFMMNECPR